MDAKILQKREQKDKLKGLSTAVLTNKKLLRILASARKMD